MFQYVIVSAIPNSEWLAALVASSEEGGAWTFRRALICARVLLRGIREKRSSREKRAVTDAALQTWTVLAEPATSTDYLLKQQPVCGGDSADLVGQFYSREGVRKFGEMHSVYLVSLLFIFSTLHVNQLTEGCSCALTHPQDAFCNSDIGG